jgi:hypothetical protein
LIALIIAGNLQTVAKRAAIDCPGHYDESGVVRQSDPHHAVHEYMGWAYTGIHWNHRRSGGWSAKPCD